MRNFNTAKQQQGAVLLIALVMLLALTVLAVSNMRGVMLESRITANRAESQRLLNVADAALREGEFRFYGSGNLRSKLEYISANCLLTNKLKDNGFNKPCLQNRVADKQELMNMFKNPLDYWGHSDTKASDGALHWMPYRGLDAKESAYYKPESGRVSYWNAYLITSSADESEALNVEYGAFAEGQGTYYYLINGQANDELAVQSTIANIYVGLNN